MRTYGLLSTKSASRDQPAHNKEVLGGLNEGVKSQYKVDVIWGADARGDRKVTAVEETIGGLCQLWSSSHSRRV